MDLHCWLNFKMECYLHPPTPLLTTLIKTNLLPPRQVATRIQTSKWYRPLFACNACICMSVYLLCMDDGHRSLTPSWRCFVSTSVAAVSWQTVSRSWRRCCRDCRRFLKVARPPTSTTVSFCLQRDYWSGKLGSISSHSKMSENWPEVKKCQWNVLLGKLFILLTSGLGPCQSLVLSCMHV